MQVSKIQFSAEELKLAENAEWILTKNGIIAKVIAVFGQLAQEYRQILEDNMTQLPAETVSFSPKVSRGEQYKGLPYVMLDCPRVFSKADVFAVRTFFWWGNHFSLTLHLKGKYKHAFQEKILKRVRFFSENDYFISISEDEWRHDFGKENYMHANGAALEFEQIIKQKEFIKLAKAWPLNQVNEMELLFKSEFAKVIKVLTTYFPNDGIVL
jgi:hypothetical protein